MIAPAHSGTHPPLKVLSALALPVLHAAAQLLPCVNFAWKNVCALKELYYLPESSYKHFM